MLHELKKPESGFKELIAESQKDRKVNRAN